VAAGTLRVANANALGAATGNLAVNGGTLDLFGNNVAAGALSGSSAGVITTSLDPDVTLTVGGAGAGTFNGVIQDGSGQLSLTKAGTGILTLGGANTYTGTTLINGGVLAVNNANALSGGGNIIFGGGTLRYVGATTDYSSLIVNSGSAVSIDTGSQTVTFGAPLAASNTGGLTVSSNAGNGVLILQGPQLYSGVTTITSGALWLGDGFSLDDGSLNNSASIVDNASLVFQTGGAENYTGSISGAGTVAMTSRGVQTLSGSNSYSGGTSLSGSGTLDYANVNALGTGPATFLNAATLQAGVAGTLGNNLVFSPGVTGTFDTQANSVTLSGVISGGGAFAKVGSGTLTVSNSNSFTGATSVNAGTLIISGSLSGSSSVSVAAAAALEVDGYLNNSAVTTVNGTLQGNGALGGITARGGTIAPGLTAANSTTATAALTAAGAVTLSGSTNFDIRLGLLGSGTDSDQLIATAGNNAVSLDGANLQLTIGSNFKNSAQISSFYLIIDGGARGTGAGNEFAQGTSFTTDGYTFTIDYATNFINSTTVSNIGTGNDVVLELTAVPEPGTIATVISGFGMLVFMMRSRRRAR